MRISPRRELRFQPAIRRSRFWLALAGLLAASAIALVAAYFMPPHDCVWFFVSGVFGPTDDVNPPLPKDCQATAEDPPEAVLQTLENERQKQGLSFEKLVVCRLPKSRKAPPLETSAIGQDLRWLPSYQCCSWQFRRHVILVGQSGPDPNLVVVYMGLKSRWDYAKQIGRSCDEKFWSWY